MTNRGTLVSWTAPAFPISAVSQFTGIHPQTIRLYEKHGLVSPRRTSGNIRVYSARDIERVHTINQLVREHGVNLAGAQTVLELDAHISQVRTDLARVARRLTRLLPDEATKARELAAARTGMLPRTASVRLRRRVRRELQSAPAPRGIPRSELVLTDSALPEPHVPVAVRPGDLVV